MSGGTVTTVDANLSVHSCRPRPHFPDRGVLAHATEENRVNSGSCEHRLRRLAGLRHRFICFDFVQDRHQACPFRAMLCSSLSVGQDAGQSVRGNRAAERLLRESRDEFRAMDVRLVQGLSQCIYPGDRGQNRCCRGDNGFVVAGRFEGQRSAPIRFHEDDVHIGARVQRVNQFRRRSENPTLAVGRPNHEAMTVLVQA